MPGAAPGEDEIERTPRCWPPTLEVDHWFSSKPLDGPYADYHDKMTAHIAIFEGYARELESDATARTHPVVEEEDEESVFRYRIA